MATLLQIQKGVKTYFEKELALLKAPNLINKFTNNQFIKSLDVIDEYAFFCTNFYITFNLLNFLIIFLKK